jgi:hypothetical protein
VYRLDKGEAILTLSAVLDEVKTWPKDRLLNLLAEPDVRTVRAASGVEYQIEVDALREGDDLRIIGGVDDGGWRSFAPLTMDFLISRDGRILDE